MQFVEGSDHDLKRDAVAELEEKLLELKERLVLYERRFFQKGE